MPAQACALVQHATLGGHALIGEARATTLRPFTVTFNANQAGVEAVRHVFWNNPTEERLRRGGSIEAYLDRERRDLLESLRYFVGTGAPA